MKFTGSIQKRLIAIILLVSTLASFIGYGSFVYWYMSDQQQKSIKLASIIGNVIGQDVAKLVLLNEVTAAADISSGLKSFENLNTMALYKINGDVVFQYSKNNKNFYVDKLPDDLSKTIYIIDDKVVLYIKSEYQNTHLGYVQLNFKIDTIWNVAKENIKMLIFVILFMFIISYLLSIYYSKKFTLPILDLVQFLEKIEVLDSLDKRVTTVENNEYGKLYDEVNTMLERIQKNQEELKIAAVAFETQNGMTITDKNNTILHINKAFTQITGYLPEEVIGKTPAVLKSGVHKKEFYDDMHSSLREHGYWHGEVNNTHKNGKVIREYLSIQTVLDNEKNIIYYVASFSDITNQIETEKKLIEKENILVQQSKMASMGEMIENIAHQWRQPLSLISTITTGILTKKEYNMPITIEEEIELFNKINDTTQYLSQTIDDFRNFFSQNKEKIDFNIKDSYLKTLNIVNSKFKTLGIEIIENVQDINLNSLDNELMQILINLLNNARDILETKDIKRVIFVDIYKENNNAIITIKDNAGGVPSGIIDRIFEPYFTTKHQSQGTGIGLYMSKEIAVKHLNATLEVENKIFTYDSKKYTGACFSIKIPLV